MAALDKQTGRKIIYFYIDKFYECLKDNSLLAC
jgi:hypothetical protein